MLEKRLLGKKITEEDLKTLQKEHKKSKNNVILENGSKDKKKPKSERYDEDPTQNSSKRTVYVNSNDPSLCEICLKVWPAKKHLWQHYIRCHKQTAATVCGICLKTNPSYSSLQTHLRETHPNLLHGCGFGSNFICKICGRYHNASSKLKLHMAIHVGFNENMLIANDSKLSKTVQNQIDCPEIKKDENNIDEQILDDLDVVKIEIKEEADEINYENMIEEVEVYSDSEVEYNNDDNEDFIIENNVSNIGEDEIESNNGDHEVESNNSDNEVESNNDDNEVESNNGEVEFNNCENEFESNNVGYIVESNTDYIVYPNSDHEVESNNGNNQIECNDEVQSDNGDNEVEPNNQLESNHGDNEVDSDSGSEVESNNGDNDVEVLVTSKQSEQYLTSSDEQSDNENEDSENEITENELEQEMLKNMLGENVIVTKQELIIDDSSNDELSLNHVEVESCDVKMEISGSDDWTGSPNQTKELDNAVRSISYESEMEVVCLTESELETAVGSIL